MGALLLAMTLGAGNPFLEEAKAHLQALEFERCLERCRQAATQWKSTPDELRDLEVTTGLCHFNLGHRRSAFVNFRTALRIDEHAELPPFSSPKALELFNKAKDALRAPAEPLAMPDQDLPADAPLDRPSPSLTPKDLKPTPLDPPPPSPWPRRALPLVLTGLAAASAGTAVGLGVNATQLANRANQAQFESDFVSLSGAARGSATGANVAWAVAGTAAVSAVIAWVVAEHE